MTKHRIDIDSSHPVKQKLERVSPATEGEINKYETCSRMESAGHRIAPSAAAWYWCQRKMEANIYGKLAWSEQCYYERCIVAYPIPNPKDIIDKMLVQKLSTFLGAASAYWCVALEEEDKYKTALATPRGQYWTNIWHSVFRIVKRNFKGSLR